MTGSPGASVFWVEFSGSSSSGLSSLGLLLLGLDFWVEAVKENMGGKSLASTCNTEHKTP